MPSEQQNVEMWQGDMRTLVFNIKNKDGTVPDLTQATEIRWWMGRNAQSTGADVFIQKSLASGISLTQTAGQIAVSILETDTLTLTPNGPRGNYYHEVEVRLPNIVSTVAIGSFTLNPALIPGA